MSESNKGFTNFLQEFSIPLIVGVLAGIVYANVDYDTYHKMVDYHIWDLTNYVVKTLNKKNM